MKFKSEKDKCHKKSKKKKKKCIKLASCFKVKTLCKECHNSSDENSFHENNNNVGVLYENFGFITKILVLKIENIGECSVLIFTNKTSFQKPGGVVPPGATAVFTFADIQSIFFKCIPPKDPCTPCSTSSSHHNNYNNETKKHHNFCKKHSYSSSHINNNAHPTAPLLPSLPSLPTIPTISTMTSISPFSHKVKFCEFCVSIRAKVCEEEDKCFKDNRFIIS